MVRRMQPHAHATPLRTDAGAGRRARVRVLPSRAQRRRRRTRLPEWPWSARQRSAQADADRRRAVACPRQRCRLCAHSATARALHSWRADGCSVGVSGRCCGCAGQRRRTAALAHAVDCGGTRRRRERCVWNTTGRVLSVWRRLRVCGCVRVRIDVEWLDPTDSGGGAAAAAAAASSGAVSQRSISQCSRCARADRQAGRRQQQLQQTVSLLVEWTKGRTARRSIRATRRGQPFGHPSRRAQTANRSSDGWSGLPTHTNPLNVTENACCIFLTAGH